MLLPHWHILATAKHAVSSIGDRRACLLGMSKLIECPSGLSFIARKFKGSEANLFTDRKLIRGGFLISRLLSATFESLVDAGPYKVSNGSPSWDSMLTGDRIVALIRLRVATYEGLPLEFKTQCDSAACRRPFDVELDLDEDLQIKRLSNEDREAFENGNRLSTEIEVDGVLRKITFHLLTGEDEKRMSKIGTQTPDRQVTMSLAQRIDEISDVHKNDKVRWLEALDLDVLSELVEKLDEHDCGVETTIERECPHCQNIMDVIIPLGGQEFFLPKRKKAARAA